VSDLPGDPRLYAVDEMLRIGAAAARRLGVDGRWGRPFCAIPSR
jgi:hypothetical protein